MNDHTQGDGPPPGEPGPPDELHDAAMAQLLGAFARDVRAGAPLFEPPQGLSARLAEEDRDSSAATADPSRPSRSRPAPQPASERARRLLLGPRTWVAAALILILVGGLLSRGPGPTAPELEWMSLSARPNLTRAAGVTEFATGERVFVQLALSTDGAAFLTLVDTRGVQMRPSALDPGAEGPFFAMSLTAGPSVPWELEVEGPLGPRAVLLTTTLETPDEAKLDSLLEDAHAAWVAAGGRDDFGVGIDAVLEVLRESPEYSTEVAVYEHIEHR